MKYFVLFEASKFDPDYYLVTHNLGVFYIPRNDTNYDSCVFSKRQYAVECLRDAQNKFTHDTFKVINEAQLKRIIISNALA